MEAEYKFAQSLIGLLRQVQHTNETIYKAAHPLEDDEHVIHEATCHTPEAEKATTLIHDLEHAFD